MKQNRRSFLKAVLLGAGALLVSPVIGLQKAFADLAKADDPLVKALGYVADAKDAKDRKDKKAACVNCQFFADAKAKQGKCQLIASGDVMATGWCRSYSKKADAKKA